MWQSLATNYLLFSSNTKVIKCKVVEYCTCKLHVSDIACVQIACVTNGKCYRFHLLQIFVCCKLHVLQIAHVANCIAANCTYCKLYVLLIKGFENYTCFKFNVANCMCCKLNVLQIPFVANCMCCKLRLLQIACVVKVQSCKFQT